MKSKKQILLLIALLSILCIFINRADAQSETATHNSDPIAELKSRKIIRFEKTVDDLLTCRMTIDKLQREHYDAHNVTPAISENWFNNYFSNLDSQHIYFLQSDIDEFRPHSTVLWLKGKQIADVDFAFAAFERLLVRMKEYAQFELQHLDDKFDFTQKESMLIDRKDEPYPATKKEQEDIWLKLVKDKILSIKIAMEKEEKKAKGELPAEDDEEDDEDDEKSSTPKKPETFEQRLARTKKTIARRFLLKTELEKTDVLMIFLNSLCELYDPHTSYLTPASQDDMDMHLSLKLQGIGATLMQDDDYIKIVEIVEGSPAEKCGKLKKNDRIVAVAQDKEEPVDVIGMPLRKVVKQIRGKKGTAVTLTIMPPNGQDTYNVRIIRDVIERPDDRAKSEKRQLMLSSGRTANILVLYLPSFYVDFKAKFNGDPNYRSTTRDMRNLILKEKDTIDGIIIDLRGNGGGGLDEAIKLSGLFFPEGNVVQKRNNNGSIEKLADVDAATQFAGPLIIMIDANSASASEIMAAALQDMGRALIVGDKNSHGKGTVQMPCDFHQPLSKFMFKSLKHPLKDLGGMKISIAKFYRINGGSTQLKGVVPDIIFPSLLDNMKYREADNKHPLPWDEIEQVPYMQYKWIPSIKDELKKRSDTRVAESPDFKKYQEDIALCKAWDENNEIPLSLEARRDFAKKNIQYYKAYNEFFKRGKNYYKPRKNSKKTLPKDFVLEESLNIMKDCIELDETQK